MGTARSGDSPWTRERTHRSNVRVHRRVFTGLCLSSAVLAAHAQQSATSASGVLPQVTVIGTTPLPGSGVDLDLVPSNVQTMGTEDLDPNHRADLVPIAAARRLSSVNLANEQGSQYQPDLVYRGFEASPVSGVAQGIAVYQNGTRVNEALGDAVNWDLIPQFAVRRLTVQSDNPVFGLNALGGATTLDMKNGFNSSGLDASLSGGSFGNLTGHAAYGCHTGHFGLYGAMGGISDDGFRYLSPTQLRQGYADFGYEGERASLHLAVSAANNDFGALGPTPVEMLAVDPRSVFTNPQTTHNEMQLVQLNGVYQPSATLLLSAALYHRHFTQDIVDGNTTDVQPCVNEPGFFCLEGANLYPADALYDENGKQVPASVLPAGATPGEIDRASTVTQTNGAAMQATVTARLLGRENHLSIGASLDDSATHYAASGELGTLMTSLQILGSGAIIDQGASPSASPPIEEPVAVRPVTRYTGIYFTDTLEVSPALAWTLSGRYNGAELDLHDLRGTALNSSHRYERFNPGTGLTYKIAPGLIAYAGYSESNRAPTAAELSCANPDQPCLLDAFLVSDPELKQVIARTYETGLRGPFSPAPFGGQVQWNLGLFRTDLRDDIMLLATRVNGFGYFANIGNTRRQGIEAGIAFRARGWSLDLSYSLVDATYRESLTVSSNSPAADAEGNIFVHPGDRLPLTPEHRVTGSIEYAPTPRWSLGLDARYTSSQFLVGDASNQEPPLPSYVVVDLHADYRLARSLQLFVAIDNLFDKTYYTFGSFSELDHLPPTVHLSDPRTYSPSPPRSVFAGVRLTL